jgi:hypothetical protein
MAKKYTLHYLNDKEFDSLPFAKVKESLGCADEKTGNAYVRKTGIRPIDQFVTDHEIAELVAKVSPHEVDGIRYKLLGNDNPLRGSGLDTLLGLESEDTPNSRVSASEAGLSTDTTDAARGTVTGSLGANTNNTSTINQSSTGSGLTDAYNNYEQNQLGFASTPVTLGGETSNIGTTGSNLSSINTPSTAQNSWSNPNSIANMFTSSQGKSSTLGTPVSLGGQTSNITGGANGLTATPISNSTTSADLGFTSPITTPKANVPLQTINQAAVSPSLQGGGDVSTTSAKNKTATKTPFLESLFGKDWRQTLLKQGVGAGISMIGQAAAGKTQTVNPTDSALYNQVVERVQSGTQVELTDAQKLAITQNYDTQLEQARKNITERYKALRPGSDIANDSQLQQALIELENDYAEQKATAITAAQLNLTEQQTAQLSQLAALDINSLATNAGISNQEAADFKTMMSSLGAMVATGGQQRVYS